MNRSEEELLYCPMIMPVPLSTGSLVVSCIATVREDCKEFSHAHSDYEIYYCLEGRQTVLVGESSVDLHPGEFVIVAPNAVHRTLYTPDVPKKYFYILFSLQERERAADRDAGEGRLFAALRADTVILATGLRPDRAANRAFEGTAPFVMFIGDCDRVGNIYTTSTGGYYAAQQI